MTKSAGNMETINYKGGEKERKKRIEKERDEDNCAENQQSAQMYGYHCCCQHAKMTKTEHKESKKQTKKEMNEVNKVVDGPDHRIHCDEDPCVFIQIELHLCKNDKIYYD
jgi:hypothetical protein